MQVFRWSSDQLGCRLNDLGKVRRAQMEFGGGSSTHWHSRQNIQFYLLEIVMFITQTSSISPVSCPKPTPLYSTQKARKHIKSPTRGIVRRYILTTLSSISLVVGPARLSAQRFGESSSGSDGVWWRFCENFQSTSNQGCIPLCKRGSLLSVPPSLCPESCVAIGSIVLSAWINAHG